MRLSRQVLWSLMGTVASRGATVASAIVTARILGVETFGSFGIVISTVSLFQAVAAMGLGTTANRFIARFRDSDPGRAFRIASLTTWVAAISGGLVAALVLFASPFIATKVLGSQTLSTPLALSSMLILAMAINGAQLGTLAGVAAFRASAGAQVVGGVLTLAATTIGALRYGLGGAVGGQAIGMTLSTMILGVTARRSLRKAGVTWVSGSWWQESSVLRSFALPAAISNLLPVPALWFTHALLFRGTDGQSEMAILTAANQWFNALALVPMVVAPPILSEMSRALGVGDRARAQTVLRAAVTMVAKVVVPAAALLALASPWIMGLYGESFRSAWGTLVLMVGAASFFCVQSPFGQAVAARGRMWISLALNASWSVSLIVASLLLLQFGAPGLAGARLFAYLGHVLLTAGVLRRLLTKPGYDPAPGA